MFASPLVKPEQLDTTAKLVKDFGSREGPVVQDHLVKHDKANKHTSYLNEMWYDMYLRNRDSFPLNLTPQLTWKDPSDPRKQDQVSA